MLATIIFLIYFGIGLFFLLCVYRESLEKYPDRSLSTDLATALVCMAYLIFWPIIIVIAFCVFYNVIGKKSYDEKEKNENS